MLVEARNQPKDRAQMRKAYIPVAVPPPEAGGAARSHEMWARGDRLDARRCQERKCDMQQALGDG
jgi:hypothetical protein